MTATSTAIRHASPRPTRADRSGRPSILFIGAGTPWTGGAGYLERQRLFIEALHQVGRVRVVTLVEPGDRDVGVESGWDVRMLAWPSRRRMGRIERLAMDLVNRRPEGARGWHCAALRRAIASEEPTSFDAVFAYRIDHAFLAGVLACERLLLDVDDPEHVRRRRRYEVGGRRHWRIERDLRKLGEWERRAARSAQRVFVCQDGDAAAFEGARIEVVPNCAPMMPVMASAPEKAPARIVALGNFAGAPDSPNVDGLTWFVDEAWPLVRAGRPDATLCVVGRMRDDLAARLEREPGVEVRGFVESLGAVFADAAMSVAPIRFGTGTRVKILESMAHGCPVVSTSMGCDGLGVTPDQEVAVADDAPAFARACVHLLDEPARRATLGAAGRRLVEDRFDRQAMQERLVRILEEALGEMAGQTR